MDPPKAPPKIAAIRDNKLNPQPKRLKDTPITDIVFLKMLYSHHS